MDGGGWLKSDIVEMYRVLKVHFYSGIISNMVDFFAVWIEDACVDVACLGEEKQLDSTHTQNYNYG